MNLEDYLKAFKPILRVNLISLNKGLISYENVANLLKGFKERLSDYGLKNHTINYLIDREALMMINYFKEKI